MAANLRHWRKRNGLTQVDAASLLGVSQPYLSLIEKRARPLPATLRNRMETVRPADSRVSSDDRFRATLSAFGYPGFAHVPPARPKFSPDNLLLSVLGTPDADARVVEALPWLVRHYAGQLGLDWLVRQAKIRNLQNRLGFVLELARADLPALSTAVHELERARLLQEATLCWDSMPTATRDWIRVNRSHLAERWNILARLATENIGNAG